MKTTLHCLHGFLGQGRDWNTLSPATQKNHAVRAPSFFSRTNEDQPHGGWTAHSLADFALTWNATLDPHAPHALLGYSMGGRLALHCLLQNPALYRQVIIVSGQAGLRSDADKKNRVQHDRAWAQRFLRDDWKDLMRDWNGQGVLQSPLELVRDEGDYDRRRLAQAIGGWSLGHQADLGQNLAARAAELPPILWLTGERDAKYLGLASELRETCPFVQFQTVPGSGHRVPWENPEFFNSQLESFLAQ